MEILNTKCGSIGQAEGLKLKLVTVRLLKNSGELTQMLSVLCHLVTLHSRFLDFTSQQLSLTASSINLALL